MEQFLLNSLWNVFPMKTIIKALCLHQLIQPSSSRNLFCRIMILKCENPGGKTSLLEFELQSVSVCHSSVKVVLYNIDVTAMCSVTKCKQSCLIDH